MKISCKTQRNASVLLLFVTATFACILFGILIYSIVKCARRLDGRPYKGGIYTNDESIIIPGDKWDTNIVCWWQGPIRMWYEMDDTIPTGSFAPPVPSQLLSKPAVPAPTGPVIYASGSSAQGVILRIDWATDQTPLFQRVTFKELGMAVDENGMPVSLSWSVGEAPGPGEVWDLQRSTNLVNWERVGALTLRNEITNLYRVTEAAAESSVYYRAVLP